MKIPRSLLLLAPLVASPGCAEYCPVDEACHPKGSVIGGKSLDPNELSAMNQMNCYRRLAGILRSSVSPQTQDAAEGHLQYILSNPDLDRVLGADGTLEYLSQSFDEKDYSGSNVFERLDKAGYTFLDPQGSSVDEYLIFDWSLAGTPPPAGAEAIEAMMRDHNLRQAILQPSWIDGAYAEIELSSSWFGKGEACKFGVFQCVLGGTPSPELVGRAYYLMIIHNNPHIEHVDRPLVYPKYDQLDVPLWSASQDISNIDLTGIPTPIKVSYPLTILAGVLDESNARLSDQNMFGLSVDAVIVDGNDNALETKVVLPGSEPDRVWLGGRLLRTAASVFTRKPLEPNSDYTLVADVSTTEATFQIDVPFHTAANDPGLDDDLPANTTAVARHDSREVEAYLKDHPHMIAPQAR